MRKLTRVFVCVACFAMLSGGLWAADSRIAVVDMNLVIKAHPSAQESYAILKEQIEEFEAEQDEMVEQRKKLEEEFEKVRAEMSNQALSEEGRALKKAEAEEKLLAVRELEQKRREQARFRQKQLSDQELRMRDRIVDKIQAIIQPYCAKKDIAIVLDSSAIGAKGLNMVVYSEDQLDITDAILKQVAKEK